MIKPKKNLSDGRKMYYYHTEICFKSYITAIVNTAHYCMKKDNGKISRVFFIACILETCSKGRFFTHKYGL